MPFSFFDLKIHTFPLNCMSSSYLKIDIFIPPLMSKTLSPQNRRGRFLEWEPSEWEMIMHAVSNQCQLIFIQEEEKWQWCNILVCLISASQISVWDRGDRYPSHRPNDHGDRAGLYLEATRGPFEKTEQRICGYQMKALGRQSEWHKHVVKDEQHLVQ